MSNNPSKTIAVIQITRIGDLIQTYHSVASFKSKHPEHRIVLICRKQFYKPLEQILSKVFDSVYALDNEMLLTQPKVLDEFLSQLQSEKIDVLINLSFSKSSNYLASVVKSQYKIGPYYNRLNQLIVEDKWSQLLYSTTLRGTLNSFNLVDFFRNIIGLKFSPDSDLQRTILSQTNKEKTILIHPFASASRKTWKGEKWVEIIFKLLKDNPQHQIIIVGAKSEHVRAESILQNNILKSNTARINNLVGKTSIPELIQLLGSAALFIGHDSMVSHLTSFTHTPTLTISLGSVRPSETIPYHLNAYSIAPKTKCFPCFPSDNCDYFQCHNDISYQVVSQIAQELLKNKAIDKNWAQNTLTEFQTSSVHLFKNVVCQSGLLAQNILDSYSDSKETLKSIYRLVWSFTLSDLDENAHLPKINHNTQSELISVLSSLQYLFELSGFGKKYSRYILEELTSSQPRLSQIKDFSKKIDEIDSLQKIILKTSPLLAPIIDFSTLRKANLSGDNIVTLTESSYTVFEESENICKIVYELIETIISEHKIQQKKQTSKHSESI